MGFASIVGAIAFMIIFASMMVFAVSIQRNFAQQASAQATFAAEQRKAYQTTMSLVSSSYAVEPIVPWVEDLYQDFALGTTSNANVQGSGSVILNGPSYFNGTFTSQEIDSGFASTNWTTIAWTSSEPAGTNITFQTRAGGTLAALAAASFTGPDGTTTDYYTSANALNETMNGNQYFQYRAYLNTDGSATPELDQVIIGVQRPTGVITLNITNSGSVSMQANQTDVYVGSVRIPRNTSQRVTTLEDLTGGQALWDPGEHVNIAVFRTLTGPELVAVANGAARAATTVS